MSAGKRQYARQDGREARLLFCPEQNCVFFTKETPPLVDLAGQALYNLAYDEKTFFDPLYDDSSDCASLPLRLR